METFAQGLSLFALKFNEPMRDMIFVEKIIELMAFACAAGRKNAQPGKFRIASQSAATHNECIDNGRADTGQFGERAPKFIGRNVKYLTLR